MSPTVRLLASAIALAVAAASLACRDDVEPFEPGDPAPSPTGRLTVSPSDDRTPTWSPSGDAIIYTADGLVGVDSGPGVLLVLSLADGTSGAALPRIQSPDVTGQHWLLAPTPRTDGEALAFAEIQATWTPHPCDLTNSDLICTPARTPDEAERPPLMQISLYARESAATGPLSDDTALPVRLQGVELVPDDLARSIVNTYPFQQLFARDGAATFRPTWSPDGERLAFSDGLGLFIWTIGSDTAEPVPNTADGVWPAWSPDGEWIAFTRLERADSTGVSCTYFALGPACWQERQEYTIGRHILSIVRPDGSEVLELGDGDEPAWGPDGATLYFTSESRIWAVPAGGGAAQPIPGTEAGREPAVSPDGRSLAFARLEGDNHNIWVVDLEP